VHGPRYDRWYGDPLPIDPSLVHPIDDGRTVEVAGLELTAIETPGHARHHHTWLVGWVGAPTETVFVGDVLGMISPGSNYISIPVPPSDIDIPAWSTSLARLRELPRGVDAILTHGGRRPLGTHLDAFVTRMNEELPLLGELVGVARSEPLEADARYRNFLLPRAKEGGLGDELAAALLGKAFRGMNLAGIADAKAAGRFADRV